VEATNQFTVEEMEQAIDLAWREGRLDYLMRNTQRLVKKKWIESKEYSRKFYIESTRRLGKSSLLLILFTEECKSAPRRKCGFFAPVKDGLLDYIEPIIEETYADCPERLRPYFDRQRFMLRFANGSRILFRGSNNKQHRVRRGQGFHLAGIDEARDVDNLQELIDSVIMPSLFSNDGYLLISSTPADTRSHPLYQLRTRAEIEKWFVRINIYEASKMDPEVYTPERIAEWKNETLKDPDGQDRWEREFECKWVVNRRKMAVPEWDTKTMAMSFGRDPYYPFYHRYMGLDWGYKDYTALIFATFNFRKARLEIDGELTFSGRDVRSDLISERAAITYKHLYGVPIFDPKVFPPVHPYRQVSDSADPILINELNKYPGMNFVPVQKAHTLEAMLQEFRILVMRGKIVVDPKCTLTIHCLENAIWDDKHAKLDQDILAHHFDHLMALVYMARMVDWEANPIPKDFMIDNVRVIELNFDKTKAEGNSAQSLEAAFGARRR
jgi:hypothetical protein